MNLKTVAAVVIAAALGSAVTYIVEKQKIDQLRAQVESIAGQLDRAKAEAQQTERKVVAQQNEIRNLQTNEVELARARNELGRLRQQRAAAVQAAPAPANPSAKASAPSAFAPGTYITRDQVSFAGFATPEATIQSLAWAAISSQSDIITQAVSPDMPRAQEYAAALQKAMLSAGPAFQGMQVMAEKLLADDRLEMLVKVDTQADPTGQANLPPPFNVVPMSLVGNEWKISGSTRNYSADWQNSGNIKTFGH